MRNLLGFLLASTMATGCIITTDNDPDPVPPGVCGDGVTQGGEQCDDGNNASGDGCSATCQSETPAGDAKITSSWSFRNAVGDNPAADQETACPNGYGTIAQYSQELDATTGAPVGQPIVDLYDCVDGANFTDGLVPGVYQTWLESTNDNNTAVYAQSLSAIVDITVQDATFDVAIFNNAGYFLFGWTLQAASNGQPVTCAQANADGVEIISTVAGGSAATTDQFNCEDGSAITPRMVAGAYNISIDAFRDGAGSLGEPVNRANQVIGDRNQVTDLGTVTLPIDGL